MSAVIGTGNQFTPEERWFRPWRSSSAKILLDLPLPDVWDLLCRPEAAVLLGADVASGVRDPHSPTGRGEQVLVHRQDGSRTVLTVLTDRRHVRRIWQHTPAPVVPGGHLEVRLGVHLAPVGESVAVRLTVRVRGPRGCALKGGWNALQWSVDTWARHVERAARDGLPTHEAWPLAAPGETYRDSARLSLCHSAVLPYPPQQVWDLVYPAEMISSISPGTRGWRDPNTPVGVGEVQVAVDAQGVESRLRIVAHDPGRHSSFMTYTRRGCDLAQHDLGTLYRQESTVLVSRVFPHVDAEDMHGPDVEDILAALGGDGHQRT